MLLKDKKITLLELVVTGRDKWENPITEKRPIENGKNIWAYVRHTSGREYYAARATQTEEEKVFVINWRDDITTENLIEYKGEEYDIVRIDDFEGYKENLKLYAKTKK